MPIIDQSKISPRTGSIYPEPYASMVEGRSSLRLGDAGGLTQFGANLIILEPGARSSLRHWHDNEDDFVMITEVECVLLQDEGEYVMRPGDCAAFPASSTNGHCLENRTASVSKFLVVGARAPREVAHYSDVDFRIEIEGGTPAFPWAIGLAVSQKFPLVLLLTHGPDNAPLDYGSRAQITAPERWVYGTGTS